MNKRRSSVAVQSIRKAVSFGACMITLLFTFLLIGKAAASGVPYPGSTPASWAMGINLSDSSNPCLGAFEAQTGINSANGNLPAYYSSQADAAADVSVAFPGKVYLDHTDPAVPAQGLPAFYVYGIHGCFGNGIFGPDIFSFSVYYDTTAAAKPPVGPTGTSCPVTVALTNPLPQYMQASFTPPNSATLAAYASTCGFTAFEWQQQITNLPAGSPITPNVPSNLPNNVYPTSCASTSAANWNAPYTCTLVAGPSTFPGNPVFPGFSDPAQGGFYYLGASYDPYPFVYPLQNVMGGATGGCTVKNDCADFPPMIDQTGKTLNFLDAPAVANLSGDNASTIPIGNYAAFVTTLVGVSTQSSAGSKLCGANSTYYCTPLFRWTWNSTFNGHACTTTIDGKCGTGGVSQTASAYPVDPTSGTGGMTIATINGIVPVAATPVFSLAAGTYPIAQSVTITDATPGATIYYTTDGTTPTSSSTAYTGPITVRSTEALQAMGAAPGYTPSPAASTTYTITPPAATQTALSVSPTSAAQGTVFILKATVTAAGVPVPFGSVTFYDGPVALGTVEISQGAGTATLKTASLVPGVNAIGAKYNQDNFDENSTSNQVSVTVTNLFPTAASLSSSGTQGRYVLTASLSALGGGIPTGSVSFKDLSTQTALGTASLTGFGVTYGGTVALSVPKTPTDIAIGDVNGDGRLDIVTASYSSSTNWIAVALGNGDGTFAAPQPITTLPGDGNGGASVALADANGDGKLDILGASWAGYGLAVFLGRGDGTFGPETDYAVDHSYANSIATGDFNGDGKIDVVTSDPSGSISVLLGNGDGTFKPERAYATDAGPEAVTVADLNNDGKLDIVVTNTAGTVSLFLGNGDGTFQPLPLVSVSSSGHFQGSRAITAGDFNGDGNIDLAVSIWDSQSVGILLGIGDGTFEPVKLISTPNASPTGVAVADMNRDGKADLAVSSYNGSIVTALLGNGDGSFRVAAYHVDNGSASLALGDLNGDGLVDLATASSTNSTASVRLAQSTFAASLANVTLPGLGTDNVSATYGGDTAFGGSTSNTISLPSNTATATATPVFSPAGGIYASAQSVKMTDATVGSTIYYTTNGATPTTSSAAYAVPISVSSTETLHAIAVATGHAPSPVAMALYQIQIMQATQTLLTVSPISGPSGAVFTLQAAVTAGGTPLPSGSVTFSDGSAVLGTAHVNASTGIATLKTASLVPGTNSIGARFSQLNFDQGSISNQVTVTVTNTFATTATLTQTGAQGRYGLTASLASFGAGAPAGTITFNDLSTQTVLGTAAPGNVRTIFGGAGTLSEPSTTEDVAIGDVNGDGHPDIVTTSYNAGINWITVALGNGNGTFAPAQALTTLAGDNNGGASVALADVNGDGKLDILAASWAGYGLAVFLGNGNGTFGSEADYGVDSGYANSIAIGDFNGDGKIDVVTSDPFGNTISVLLGKGDGTFQAEHAYPTDISPEAVTVADFNNDGRLDIAVANTTGTASVFLGNGDGTFESMPLVAVSYSGHYQGGKAIAAGEFNGDGKIDLAISIWDSQSVGILMGNGDGTFGPVRLIGTPNATPSGLAVADLNRDGRPDLVESSYNGGIATVLLGTGDGSFQVAAYPVDNGSVSVAASDINGDGLVDFVTVSSTNSTASVRLGQTTFSASVANLTLPGSGTDNVSATYSGDATFARSTSNTLSLPSNAAASATPTFSPAAGIYTTAQSVKIADTTTGATIYYTTNGTPPTTSSTKYAGAISVSATQTIKAIAVATGYAQSPVASAAYSITPPAATPTFSPVAGTYTTTQSVKIADTTTGATIYYTTNGTAPTTSSTKYAGAISVSATQTIKAIAVATGYAQSAVASAAYTIQ